MKTPRVVLGWVLALVALIGVTAFAQAESQLDFTLVNKTGYDIKEVFIAPSSEDDWDASDKVSLPGVVKDGASVDLVFHPKATAAKWDLRIIWVDGGDAVDWSGFDLTKISKITLFYDEKTQKTTAETE